MYRHRICPRFAMLGVVLMVALGAGRPAAIAQSGLPNAPSIGFFAPASLTGRIEKDPSTEYPAIARAAQVRGHVILRIAVLADGRLASAEVLAGHPMLDQAALNAVRAWRLRPVSDAAAPSIEESWVAFAFGTGALTKTDVDAVTAADVALKRCEGLADAGPPAMSVPACADAHKITAGVLEGLRGPFDRRARLALGKAFLAANEFNAAIAVVAPLATTPRPAGGTESALAVRLTAKAQGGLGRFEDAAKTCENARARYSDFRDVARRFSREVGPDLLASRTADLRAVTIECADLLDKSGKPKDAARERKRAAELK